MVAVIRLLLDAGSDPAIVSKNGDTAGKLARDYGNEAAIRLLGGRGRDRTARGIRPDGQEKEP